MSDQTSSGLALVIALGFALQAAAQGMADADADQDQLVTSEEAIVYSERLFDEISERGDEMTMEQFNAAMIGAETGSAEDLSAWAQADSDQSGAITREDWLNWRQERFDEAAGDEGGVDAGLYSSLYTGDTTGGDDTTGGAVSDEPSTGAEANPDAAANPDDGAPADDAEDGDAPAVH